MGIGLNAFHLYSGDIRFTGEIRFLQQTIGASNSFSHLKLSSCMRFKYFFLFLLFFSSCKKEIQTTTQIFGHAGNGLNSSTSVYNENTKESIELCIETPGTKGVEIDIQFSKEGSAWCFHDVTLDEETNGEGYVSDKTDAELSSLEYKNGKTKLCRLTQIPTDFWGKEIVFDLREATKEGGVYHNDTIIDRFISECEMRFPTTLKTVVVNTNLFIDKFKTANYTVLIDAVSVEEYINFPGYALSDGISISTELITADEIKNFQQVGKKVLIFGARSPKYIRKSLKKNADIFLADDINATLIERYK